MFTAIFRFELTQRIMAHQVCFRAVVVSRGLEVD